MVDLAAMLAQPARVNTEPLFGEAADDGLQSVGVAALATKPLEAGVLFSRADCSRFEMSLEHTGWQINEIYDLSVRIDFDCRNAAGDAASGSLVAEHCH